MGENQENQVPPWQTPGRNKNPRSDGACMRRHSRLNPSPYLTPQCGSSSKRGFNLHLHQQKSTPNRPPPPPPLAPNCPTPKARVVLGGVNPSPPLLGDSLPHRSRLERFLLSPGGQGVLGVLGNLDVPFGTFLKAKTRQATPATTVTAIRVRVWRDLPSHHSSSCSSVLDVEDKTHCVALRM